MGIIIFVLLALVVAAIFAGSKAEQEKMGGEVKTHQPSQMSNAELERKVEKDSRDAAFLSAMLIGKTLTDTTRRLNQWDRERKQRQYDKWHWQEKVRRENPSFNEHYDDDF